MLQTLHASSLFSPLEHEAIGIGLRDGEATVACPRVFGFLRAFGPRPTPLADTRLEALRAYAERARVALVRGGAALIAPLADAGFSTAQIALLKRVVAPRPSGGGRV